MSYKVAYPIKEESIMHKPYNVEKWIEIFRLINAKNKEGESFPLLFNKYTEEAGMDSIEKEKFGNWIKFYKNNPEPLYKGAGTLYYSGDEGYILPISKPDYLKPQDSSMADDSLEKIREKEEKEKEEKRKQRIKQTKKSLVSRLDSIEKILRTEEGHALTGDELDDFVEATYDLKKKINKLNKTNASSDIYEDMLICQANKFNNKKFVKSATLFIKLADTVRENGNAHEFNCNISFNDITSPEFLYLISVAQDPAVTTQDNAPKPPPPPQNVPTNQSAEAPVAPVEAPVEDKEDAISELSKRVDPTKEHEDKKDKNNSVDDEVLNTDLKSYPADQKYDEVPYGSSSGSLVNAEKIELDLSAYAQAAPKIELDNEETPDIKLDKTPEVKPNLEIKPNLEVKDENKPSSFDAVFENALKNVTIDDIISKLEAISNIHHIREIPRQLALIDIMLQAVGLSGVFPQLSEAENKSLESHSYVSTRVDDILANLRSMLGKKLINLEKNVEPNNETKILKENLDNQRDQEEERKRARREIEYQKPTSNKPEENIELDQEEKVPEVTNKVPEPKIELEPEVKPEFKPEPKIELEPKE